MGKGQAEGAPAADRARTKKPSGRADAARTDAEIRDLLRAAGLRSTQPRLAVYRQLQSAEGPITHGTVAEQLAPQGFDRATVYRNLIDLCDAGLAQRTDHGDHLWRFELLRSGDLHDVHAHAHFLCTDCGQVECLPEATVRLAQHPRVPRAVGARKVEIQVKGVCDVCAT